jgi:hypothetical protein
MILRAARWETEEYMYRRRLNQTIKRRVGGIQARNAAEKSKKGMQRQARRKTKEINKYKVHGIYKGSLGSL